jgi:hypothetical protein
MTDNLLAMPVLLFASVCLGDFVFLDSIFVPLGNALLITSVFHAVIEFLRKSFRLFLFASLLKARKFKRHNECVFYLPIPSSPILITTL